MDKLSSSGTHSLYKDFDARRSAAAPVSINVEHRKWTAQKRVLIHILPAFQHEKLARLGQPGLFRRAESQEIVVGPKIPDAFYRYFFIEHFKSQSFATCCSPVILSSRIEQDQLFFSAFSNMNKPKGKLLMKAEEIDLVLARISAEIIEKLGREEEFALVGIRSRGVHLAERLRDKIGRILDRSIPFGILDITLYRDDLTTVSSHPILRETAIDFDINNLSLVLVDDVLYTGRTIRASLDGITDLGRPRRIQLAVLVDRGGRELPIQADYVGKRIDVAEGETVEVRLEEVDGEEKVVLVQ